MQFPHPVTGQPFDSPAPPGTGWPGDPADAGTPRAASAGGVRRFAARSKSLPEVDEYVSVCRACPRLVRWREKVAVEKRRQFAEQPYWGRAVPSRGVADPRILVIGLAPAAHGGNRTGLMFSGDNSGTWIIGALHRAGYADHPDALVAELSEVRIVAPVHCAPPDNKPTPAELATCGTWLDRELVLADRAESALALGTIAWQAAHAAAVRIGWQVPRPRAKFGHGAETAFTRPDGSVLRLVGSYHVSQQNTFTGRLTEQMLDEVIARL
ncbi:uracil-DNA glycosylase [Enemella sp. A6]|uniref:uracil-DNA glycosylase n=1 Tax=Enemella sp. A6 TaxID=3440152 RepID=UPI003EBD0C89